MTGFEAEKLMFSYHNGENVLDGTNLKLEKGTINVILGLNGCGKTTLIKVMAGVLKPNEGTVRYDGIDIHSLSDLEKSKIIAYVKQHGSSISGYSVEDYLLMSTVNSLDPWEEPGKKEMENVDSCLRSFNIEHLKHKNVGELSGGQRQLIFLCAALVQNTDAVLLDEPTSALDPKNRSLVLKQLYQIAESGKKTILLSTHELNQAQFLGANVILMKDGKIVDRIPGGEPITKERLMPIYGEDICYSSELPYDEITYRNPLLGN